MGSTSQNKMQDLTPGLTQAYHLASYRCPERIYFVDEMPLNAAGKILRHVLLDKISGQR